MPLNRVILWITACGILLGAADRIAGNRLKLGEKFEEGFQTMGALALSMVGIVCLAPVIARLLKPVAAPLFHLLGADPAMLGAILANDMGGYTLAVALAEEEQAGLLSGCIVASMLGCTLVFTIPVGLGLLEQRQLPEFCRGLLIGLITVPVGGFVGGVTAGFALTPLLHDLLPVTLFSLLLAAGLKWIPDRMIRGCAFFGKGITAVAVAGLGIAGFSSLTGVSLIRDMTSVTDAMQTVGSIAVVLAGAFPLLTLLTAILKKPLSLLGNRLGLDADSTAGLIFGMANAIPVFSMMKKMDRRGVTVNTAWLVSASAVLGDHLGFTAGVRPDMIVPVIVGKLSAGAAALALALLLTREKEQKEKGV